MKQFLQRTFDVLGPAGRGVVNVSASAVSSLRAVDIDAPRAVTLCVILQLLIAITVVLTFRSSTVTPVEPREGQSEATSDGTLQDTPKVLTEPEVSHG